MWIVFWHALLWLPKLMFYGMQRVAVWSGTLYLYRKGKSNWIFYVLSATLYIISWVLIILLVRETLAFKISYFIPRLMPSKQLP